MISFPKKLKMTKISVLKVSTLIIIYSLTLFVKKNDVFSSNFHTKGVLFLFKRFQLGINRFVLFDIAEDLNFVAVESVGRSILVGIEPYADNAF